MKAALLFLLAALSVYISSTQQCHHHQVTVCNDDVIPYVKGQKSEIGYRGKSGPKDEPGELSEKGLRGESCALGSLGVEIMKKLTDVEEILALSIPPLSCATSAMNGRQILRSGNEIFCEGGWTVFQRRFDGSVDFQVNWNEYKNGLGNLSGEFWLGLDEIHRLTSQGNCKLRVELRDFDDNEAFADYGFSHFQLNLY